MSVMSAALASGSSTPANVRWIGCVRTFPRTLFTVPLKSTVRSAVIFCGPGGAVAWIDERTSPAPVPAARDAPPQAAAVTVTTTSMRATVIRRMRLTVGDDCSQPSLRS